MYVFPHNLISIAYQFVFYLPLRFWWIFNFDFWPRFTVCRIHQGENFYGKRNLSYSNCKIIRDNLKTFTICVCESIDTITALAYIYIYIYTCIKSDCTLPQDAIISLVDCLSWGDRALGGDTLWTSSTLRLILLGPLTKCCNMNLI